MPEQSVGNGHAASEFAELRGLLLGPELAQLRGIQERLDSPERRAEEVAAVLGEAFRLRGGRDRKIRLALHPIIEDSLRISVQRDPAMVAGALFPIIGPAIRKAVASALDGLMQSFNQALEQGFSLRSLRWRWEAMRTGKSYAEIVLIRSILYRVQQVFLIHRKTGLLLEHREAPRVTAQDADLISGMLTAIQDFVKDSFSAAEHAELETVQLSEFHLWILHGPQAILAGAVKGTAPRALRQVFERAVEQVHQKFAPDLVAFDGDTTPFHAARPYLEACLLGGADAPRKRWPALVWIVPLLLLLGAGLWLGFSIRDARRWRTFVDSMRNEPGIVVTSAESSRGHFFLSGLRDPLSRDPQVLLSAASLTPEKVEFAWQPYESLQPGFVAARRLRLETEAVERQSLHFRSDSFEIPTEELSLVTSIAAQVTSLLNAAARAGKSLRLEVVGHTDDSGTELKNGPLSQERAQQVLTALTEAGVPGERLSARGVATAEPLRKGSSVRDKAFNRSVSFRVIPGRS